MGSGSVMLRYVVHWPRHSPALSPCMHQIAHCTSSPPASTLCLDDLSLPKFVKTSYRTCSEVTLEGLPNYAQPFASLIFERL
jgi:hypothetical protein